jgi:hypothetical protein
LAKFWPLAEYILKINGILKKNVISELIFFFLENIAKLLIQLNFNIVVELN